MKWKTGQGQRENSVKQRPDEDGLDMMIWSAKNAKSEAVAVNVPNKTALLDDLECRFQSGQGFSVATINLDHVVKLSRDPAFVAAYLKQSHITADGNPIVWLCHLAGQKNVALVPGSELIGPAADLAARCDIAVAFFGSTQSSLDASAAAMTAQHPGLEISLTLSPSMGFDPEGPEADTAIARIRDSGARLVFLALGAPKQERFAAYAQTRLPQVGFLSIGAGLDFVSGAQKRAPVWVRRLAAEWLWRMLSNPRRLAARYGACILAMPGLTLRALAIRFRTNT